MSVGWGHKIHAWRAIGVSRGRLMTHDSRITDTTNASTWQSLDNVTENYVRGGRIFFQRNPIK